MDFVMRAEKVMKKIGKTHEAKIYGRSVVKKKIKLTVCMKCGYVYCREAEKLKYTSSCPQCETYCDQEELNGNK